MSNDTMTCRNCGPDSPCKTRANGSRVCIACERAADRRRSAKHNPARDKARREASRKYQALKRAAPGGKEAQRVANAEQYAKSGARHNARRRAKTKENKRKLINLKGGACECCGLVDTCDQVYDFHHREPELKKFQLTGTTLSHSITTKIIIELFKCDLLCANCHRRTHASD